MGRDLIRKSVRDRYCIEERRHACAILATDFPSEFEDLLECLDEFVLAKSEIVIGGGGKSKIAGRFDDFLLLREWKEMKITIGRTINNEPSGSTESHKVDFCKGKIAIEVEWNNKDTFYSRDLAAFRMLHDLGAISVGVMITRADELQDIFDGLGLNTEGKKIGKKYGASTTHWGKIIPRVDAGEAGNCPLLLVGITAKCYRPDR